MREIVLDTETTGFDPFSGHRIVEIGALELVNLVPTGRQYHQYVNPERDMPEDAFQVHGLSNQFLAGKPVFTAVAADFLEFIGEARLVIHNAEFDMRFVNAELEWSGREPIPIARAVDTLRMARQRYPGGPNSLDALCKRFGIDNSNRELHGAMIDADLLAQVYLELKGGRQPGLILGADDAEDGGGSRKPPRRPRRAEPLPPRLAAGERAAHAEFIAAMPSDEPVWKRIRSGD